MVLKDLKHVGYIYDTQVMDFILWLCLSDSQRTVQEAGITASLCGWIRKPAR